jgi:hypothetical protein
VPNDKGDNEKAPDFRLQAAGHDIGAAWKKTSEAGREYISVTLDDPSFPATVYARLIEGERHARPDLVAQQAPGGLTAATPPAAAGRCPYAPSQDLKLAFREATRSSALPCCIRLRWRCLNDRQRGHVLAALDLAHVGALDAGEVRQRLLRDAALRPQRAPPRRATAPIRRRRWWRRPVGRA